MKCSKVKNPCKLCFQSVNNRNGLQCKGACKKWAHFKCLNYTPGKISDYKAGLIRITCPCPDCSTSEPKEVLTKPPFTCTHEGCPATKPPVCEISDCPNKRNPIPAFPPPISTPPNLTPPRSGWPEQLPPQHIPNIPVATKCPTPPQKTSCPASPRSASPPKKSSCPASPRNASPCRVASPPKKICPSPLRKASPPRNPVAPRGPASPPLQKTATRPICPSCPKHCPKRSNENLNPDNFLSPQRSQSCSLDSRPSCHSDKTRIGVPRSCSSDSALLNAQDQKMLYNAVEQICDTVGHLSCQLKDLMWKMMNTFQRAKQKK